MARNEADNVAEAVVTYLVPVGPNPLRTDLPNPETVRSEPDHEMPVRGPVFYGVDLHETRVTVNRCPLCEHEAAGQEFRFAAARGLSQS